MNILSWESNTSNSNNNQSILNNKKTFKSYSQFNSPLFSGDITSSNINNNPSNQYNIKIEDVRSMQNHLRFLSEDNIKKMNDL
jgi:hypothetical protein